MVFLLIGGTGKTALRLAQFLQNDNHQFLLASRRGQSAAPQGMPAIKFDWMDNSTWKEPFLFPFVGGEKISAIYLMQPIAAEPWKPMNEFIDYARQEHNINRFVLVGGTSSQAGGPGVGMVWRHFLQTGVDYCVLRPSWFMGRCLRLSMGILSLSLPLPLFIFIRRLTRNRKPCRGGAPIGDKKRWQDLHGLWPGEDPFYQCHGHRSSCLSCPDGLQIT